MTATLTKRKTKKSKPSASGSKPARPSPRKPAAPSIEDLRATVKTINQKIADAGPFKNLDGLGVELREAQEILEAAELAAMPAPKPIIASHHEAEVKLDTIAIGDNHRDYTRHEDAATIRLSRSIDEVGLQHRIGVAQYGGDKKSFELIYGSRRVAAAKRAGWKGIPAKIYVDPSPLQVELLRTAENFDRKGLSAAEQALAVARMVASVEETIDGLDLKNGPESNLQWLTLLDSLGGGQSTKDKTTGLHHTAPGIIAYVAQLLGYPVAWVRDRMYVSRLTGNARKLLAVGRIDLGHARQLSRLADPKLIDDFAERAARNESGTGGSTAADVQKWVEEALCSLKTVPWRLEIAFGADKRKGCEGWACASCPHNSNADPSLFEGSSLNLAEIGKAAGICLNPSCFAVKKEKTEQLIQAGVEKVRGWLKDLKKSERPESLNATVLAEHGLLPEAVKSSSFVRRVQKEIEPETAKVPEATAARAASRSSRDDEPKASPEEIARRKYINGPLNGWIDKAVKPIVKAINADPARLVGFTVLEYLGVFDQLRMHEDGSTYQYSLAANIKHDRETTERAESADAVSVFAQMASPTLEGLQTVVAKGKRHCEPYDINNMVPAAIVAVAKALGVELEPIPPRPSDTPAEKSSEPDAVPLDKAMGKKK